MEKKAAVFDADGVAIKKSKVFSIRLSEKYNIPLEKIGEFFKTDFQDCLVGKSDLKEILPRWLSAWGIGESVDDILEFWFAAEAEPDMEVLAEVDNLRAQGVRCYLATNNEKYRVEFLMEKTELNDHFDGVFTSAELGLKKPHEEFFNKISHTLGIEPFNIWFWDDSGENVEGAHKAGWRARLYTGIADIQSCEEKLI